MQHLLQWLSLPEVSLSTVFVVALLSATVLPIGSEAVVFVLVSLKPDLFWSAIGVATVGNTIGGMITWWMGLSAHLLVDKVRAARTGAAHPVALRWLNTLGPKACLLSWLPVVGDPLCAVAGWLRMPALPCLAYMAVGKFLRYLVMTSLLLWVF
jgi:membrane protein YqaA with SNARE-associated domain